MSAAGDTDTWRRHPADRARLVAALLALGLGLGAVGTRPEAVRGASADAARLLSRLPDVVEVLLAGILQLAAAVAPVALVVVLLRGRRHRLLAVATGAGVGAAVVMAALQGWLDRTVPPSVLETADAESWLTGASFPSGAYLAAVTAVVTVLLPGTSRRWRRWLVAVVVLAAACRVSTAAVVPVNVLVTLALGSTVGSLALVALGAPTRRLAGADAEAGARRAGAAVTGLTAPDGGVGTGRFAARATADDRPVIVAVVGRDDRDAEVFSRAVRAITTKDVEDRPLRLRGSTRLRHEALCTLMAAEVVAAPEVLGVGETPDGDAVLVLTDPGGIPLSEVDDTALDDGMLQAAWVVADALHRRRLAHGALTLDALRATADGVVVTDLGTGEVGAADEALAADVADLLVSMAGRAGAERAVRAAVASPVGREALEAALPRLQPLAMTPATRRSVDDLAGLCREVREALGAALGVDDVELIDMARVTPAKLLSSAGTLVLVALVLAFVGNISAISAALQEVDWAVLPLLVVLVAVGTVAGGWGLASAVVAPLPFLRTCEVMLAQGFLNRFTPANAGGMALRARYLQKHGVELTGAATSVGLTSAASGAVQVVFLAGTYAWAGSSGSLGFSLPRVSTLAAGLLVVGALGGVVYVTPWGRRVVFGRLGQVVGNAWRDLRALAARPSKIIGLFGSAAVSKITTIAAFVACCAAADISLATSQLTFLYMTAGTVASAAPTPGGVGAIEAALVAALTGAGVDPAAAVSAVVVFRLVTYWGPVPPSYLALRHLRSIDAV